MLYRTRIKLAKMLKRYGLYVRMHAYEYLLGFRNHIIGVLLLEPWKGMAYIYLNDSFNVLEENVVATLSSLLKSIDPNISVFVKKYLQR